jgi:hypothetical protein
VELNGTEATLTLCYSPFTGPPSAQALFRGYTPICHGTAKDGGGAAVVLHGAADGKVYAHGTANGSVWDDAGAAIQHVVRAPYLGHDVAHDKRFSRLDVTMRAGSNMTDLAVDYETPYGLSVPQSSDLTSAISFWDEMEWGDPWSSDSIEAPLRVGLNGQGRWIRPRIQHHQAGEQVNGNFTILRDTLNTYAVLTDVARTITVTHTFTAAQTFAAITATTVGTTGAVTAGNGLTVSAGGASITGGLTVATSGLVVSAGGATVTGTVVLPSYGGGTVSVGAADSGGSGFRVLRVPNS